MVFLRSEERRPHSLPLSLKPVAPSFPPKSGLRLRQRRISQVSNPSPILSLSRSFVLIIFSLRSVACFVFFHWFFFLNFLRRDVWSLSRSDDGDAGEFDVYGFWFGHQGMIFMYFLNIFVCGGLCVCCGDGVWVDDFGVLIAVCLC